MSALIETEAFVLHARSYRNSSLLVDVLTPKYGMMRLIAKGAQKPASKLFGCLDLLSHLHITVIGKGDLKTLTQADILHHYGQLGFSARAVCLYINELLLKLSLQTEQGEIVFNAYQKLLIWLENAVDIHRGLRRFELLLCGLCGYEIVESQIPEDTEWVRFDPANGIVVDRTHAVCRADVLRAFLQTRRLTSEQYRQIDRFMLSVVNHLVGGQPIKSRELL
ncbi:DNA repair protein RecO [Marinicella sp. W31]|uniref:DNA repair protein RecO n=1 Tax=Marinicella sp. W31 TaxID=3023713 RepID=UPI003756CD29